MAEEAEKAKVEDLNPIVAKFIKIRRYIDFKKAQLKLELKNYEEAKAQLAAHLAAVLTQTKLQNFRTEAGLAFTSERVNYHVVDMAAYLQWLKENELWETAKIEPIAKLTDEHAAKMLHDYIDKNRHLVAQTAEADRPKFTHFLPPGVTRSITVIASVRATGGSDDDEE